MDRKYIVKYRQWRSKTPQNKGIENPSNQIDRINHIKNLLFFFPFRFGEETEFTDPIRTCPHLLLIKNAVDIICVNNVGA